MTRKNSISKLAQEIQNCTLCRLHKNRIHVVPGEGNPSAYIMFIGEAPGRQENEQGRPFVGAAGKYLDQLLNSIGWERKDVFITSVVKDQPPKNRDPKPDEIKICTKAWLEPQIEAIDPKIIVPLGRHALNYFLPEAGKISEVHGQAFDLPSGRICFPLYHPAAALYRQDLKPILEEDFQKLEKLTMG